ncbi:outer membrane protein assembly factor BamE [Pararhodospirillum photometricum]|nr:outer membrane protein assembly factor BamE [Pararhodospirillum photometricum]
MGRLTAGVLGAALVLGTAGCSHDINAHGNLPTEEAMGRLKVGEQTRADIQTILGTPSSTSLFGGETWYYISNQTAQVAFYAPEELRRQVIAVRFDDQGVLQGVDRLSREDGRVVEVVKRETPTRGTEANFFQEFLGNLGRVSASQMGNNN